MDDLDNRSDPGGARVDTGDRAQRARAGSLYVVATPLGNLRDVTLRAVDILASADRIGAEDTRVTAKLLARLGIARRPTAIHAHNEAGKAARVVEWLARGDSVALVTDAGTPGLSDPGARIVRAVREAGHPVVPVPGPSALAAAVSAAGLAATRFVFVGFPPTSPKALRELLGALGATGMALVFYEAPHRVRETVAAIATVLDPGRTLVVARELTKMHESIASMPLGAAGAWFAGDPDRERGEFVLLVDEPAETPRASGVSADALAWMDALAAELAPSRAARIVAERTGAPRDLLYAHAVARGKPERR